VSDDGSLPRGETAFDAAGGAPADATVWRRSASAAYVESDERVVVLDLDHLDLQPYVFEGSAAQIWACLDGDRTEAEVVTDLAEAFGVPADQVAHDVRGFIDRLADLGLIVREDPR
jgi:pyrroloquinoline quinone biosynthesis protein D